MSSAPLLSIESLFSPSDLFYFQSKEDGIEYFYLSEVVYQETEEDERIQEEICNENTLMKTKQLKLCYAEDYSREWGKLMKHFQPCNSFVQMMVNRYPYLYWMFCCFNIQKPERIVIKDQQSINDEYSFSEKLRYLGWAFKLLGVFISVLVLFCSNPIFEASYCKLPIGDVISDVNSFSSPLCTLSVITGFTPISTYSRSDGTRFIPMTNIVAQYVKSPLVYNLTNGECLGYTNLFIGAESFSRFQGIGMRIYSTQILCLSFLYFLVFLWAFIFRQTNPLNDVSLSFFFKARINYVSTISKDSFCSKYFGINSFFSFLGIAILILTLFGIFSFGLRDITYVILPSSLLEKCSLFNSEVRCLECNAINPIAVTYSMIGKWSLGDYINTFTIMLVIIFELSTHFKKVYDFVDADRVISNPKENCCYKDVFNFKFREITLHECDLFRFTLANRFNHYFEDYVALHSINSKYSLHGFLLAYESRIIFGLLLLLPLFFFAIFFVLFSYYF